MSGPSTPVHSDHSESTVEGLPPRPGVVPISPPRALTPPPVAGPSRPPGYPRSGQTPIAPIPLRAIPPPAPVMSPPAPLIRPPIRGPPPEHESSGFSGVGPSYPCSPLSIFMMSDPIIPPYPQHSDTTVNGPPPPQRPEPHPPVSPSLEDVLAAAVVVPSRNIPSTYHARPFIRGPPPSTLSSTRGSSIHTSFRPASDPVPIMSLRQ
nr:PREDICTED: pollen-specific leucine-rich repeat extensin-like protein 3 [Daucus carota subsp. sativus]